MAEFPYTEEVLPFELLRVKPMKSVTDESAIKALVHTAVESYATGFQARHEGEVDNPDGTLNMKIHNVFIAALGPEIQYYTALVRSLDSSLGNMLERLATKCRGSVEHRTNPRHRGTPGELQTSPA